MPDSLTQNPYLTNWDDDDTVVVQDWQEETVKTVVMERPKYWQYRRDTTQGANPNQLPQSLHVDNVGFKISGGYFPWLVGYAQRVTGLEAGKRYLLKIVYQNQLHKTTKPEAVRFRGEISGATPLYGDWQWLPSMQEAGKEQVYLLLFEMEGAGDIEVAFMCRNEYGEGATDVVISYIGLEPVSDDYGGTNVPTVIPSGVTPPDDDDDDDDEPAPTPEPSPTGDTAMLQFQITLYMSPILEVAAARVFDALAAWVNRQ